MAFYVYENWTRDRGRIHRAACPACNDGRGMQQADSGRHGKWHGPFEDRAAAYRAAAALKRADMAPCSRCRP